MPSLDLSSHLCISPLLYSHYLSLLTSLLIFHQILSYLLPLLPHNSLFLYSSSLSLFVIIILLFVTIILTCSSPSLLLYSLYFVLITFPFFKKKPSFRLL